MQSCGAVEDIEYWSSGGFMDILRIGSLFTAFIRPTQGANVGLIHTTLGMILIDTTSFPAAVHDLLEAVGASPKEVRLVINTHFHEDHTWGNQLFDCPILAHRLCREAIRTALVNDWSPEALRSYLADLEQSDPSKARDFRKQLEGLVIKIPNQVFEDRLEGELGGVMYEFIHFGGHTPDTSIVWVPERKVLYASDLIFQGRYPYIFDADIPAWIDALNRLLDFEAETIIPGHGVSCSKTQIIEMRDYLQATWDLTKKHHQLGHSMEQTLADPGFPVFSGEGYERLHLANIRYMYNHLI
jgi:cyclase